MIIIDKYIKFLVKNQINQIQFLGLYLAYSKRNDLIEMYKKEFTDGMKIIPPEDLADLRTKGYINTSPQGDPILTDKFKHIFIDKFQATDEIFAAYPSFMYNQGVNIPLAAMDRSVFANLYEIAIMGSIEEHFDIMADIAYGKQQGLLNIGLEKFLKSKHWLSIRKKRLDNEQVIITKTKSDNEF